MSGAFVEVGAVLQVTALCTAILLAAEWLHRRVGVQAEWTRKLVHVLMGLTAAAFPWFFRDPRSAVVVCAAFTAVLAGSLWASRLASVHAVDRRTAGALWFPVAVAIVFVAARGRAALYVVSMLVLALADPAAAMVGRAFGAHRFHAGRDAKSLEGSLAFLVVASACVWAGLRLTTLGAVEAMLGAVVVGALLAAIEAVSPAGSDNVFVPVGAFLLLGPIHG